MRLRPPPIHVVCLALVACAHALGASALEGQSQTAPACPDQRPASAATLGDLLQGNLAGVNVLQLGGASAGAKQIRIRGVNSVRHNNPIVFVDDIRVTAISETGLRGMHSVPLLELVDPMEITRVEVLRGPAATIQYADASGGVIKIYTRRGGDVAGEAASPAACGSQIRKP